MFWPLHSHLRTVQTCESKILQLYKSFFRGQTDPSWSFCHCTFDFYTSGRPEDGHVMDEARGRTFIQHNIVRCVRWWTITMAYNEMSQDYNAAVCIYHTILHHYMFQYMLVNITRDLSQNGSAISSLYRADDVFDSLTKCFWGRGRLCPYYNFF